jgi:hypothetical protein
VLQPPAWPVEHRRFDSFTDQVCLDHAHAQRNGPGSTSRARPSPRPRDLAHHTFALSGTWTVSDESVTAGADAAITLNFVADDVYLVTFG